MPTRFARPALLRRVIQIFFAAFFLYVGYCFYLYLSWATGATESFSPRPPSAEAFLPISALMAARRLALTGLYDHIHPAGLTIFLCALAVSLLFRKAFCGFLCPIGFLTDFLGETGARLGLARPLPAWLYRLLSLPKYLLLLFFIQTIFFHLSPPDLEIFLNSEYNRVADSKMFLFFLHPSHATLVVMAVLALGSMLIPGLWCRGLCPYGALLGVFSWFSPLAVRRAEPSCTGCRRCSRACPVRLEVHRKKRVSSPECLGCTKCLEACPEPDCLNLAWGWGAAFKKTHFWIPALGTLIALILFFQAAAFTGHWERQDNPATVRLMHKNIEELAHP